MLVVGAQGFEFVRVVEKIVIFEFEFSRQSVGTESLLGGSCKATGVCRLESAVEEIPILSHSNVGRRQVERRYRHDGVLFRRPWQCADVE